MEILYSRAVDEMAMYRMTIGRVFAFSISLKSQSLGDAPVRFLIISVDRWERMFLMSRAAASRQPWGRRG